MSSFSIERQLEEIQTKLQGLDKISTRLDDFIEKTDNRFEAYEYTIRNIQVMCYCRFE